MLKLIANKLRNPGSKGHRVGRVSDEDLGRWVGVHSAIDGQARKPGRIVDFFYGGDMGETEVIVLERDDESQLWLTPVGQNWQRIDGMLYGKTGQIVPAGLTFALFW